MANMIEHISGFKVVTTILVKPLLAAAIAFGWYPAADFIILQVDSHVLLNPFSKGLMEELKIILGVLISFTVLFKIIIGIVKLIKQPKQ